MSKFPLRHRGYSRPPLIDIREVIRSLSEEYCGVRAQTALRNSVIPPILNKSGMPSMGVTCADQPHGSPEFLDVTDICLCLPGRIGALQEFAGGRGNPACPLRSQSEYSRRHRVRCRPHSGCPPRRVLLLLQPSGAEFHADGVGLSNSFVRDDHLGEAAGSGRVHRCNNLRNIGYDETSSPLTNTAIAILRPARFC
jgi:hypothetical protein